MSTIRGGIIPPVVTPLTADGELDVASYERSINRMIDAGVDGLFVLGSSSEVVFLTDKKRAQVVQAAVSIVNGRVPLLVGAIDTTTERVIERAQRAKEWGADAIVTTAPFYALLGPKEIERHFRLVHEAVDLPLFAYDLPVCVHVKLMPDMLLRLARDGVLAGVKDSSGDDVSFRNLSIMRKEAGVDFVMLTGHEVVVDGAYLSGADGCVPGLGNVDPYVYVKQWKAAQAGQWDRVRELQDYAARLMRITACTTEVGYAAGVGGFKTALQLLGVFETNEMTEPVQALKGDNVAAVEAVLRNVGLLS